VTLIFSAKNNSEKKYEKLRIITKAEFENMLIKNTKGTL